jgi:hypothetical protein
VESYHAGRISEKAFEPFVRIRPNLAVLGTPGLRMPDEIHPRKPLQHLVESLKAEIVSPVFEVQRHGHIEIVGDAGNQVDVSRIGFHRKFLFADADSPNAQILFQYGLSLVKIGQFVGEEDKLFWILPRQLDHRIVAPAPTASPYFEPAGSSTVAEDLRTRHYSRRTEDAYLHWTRRFLVFHNGTHPP